MNIDKINCVMEFNELLNTPEEIKKKCSTLEEYESVIQSLESVMTFDQLVNAIELIKDEEYIFKNKLFSIIRIQQRIVENQTNINQIQLQHITELQSNLANLNGRIFELDNEVTNLHNKLSELYSAVTDTSIKIINYNFRS